MTKMTDNLISEIIDLYVNQKISIKNIRKIVHIKIDRIKTVLIENNIELRYLKRLTPEEKRTRINLGVKKYRENNKEKIKQARRLRRIDNLEKIRNQELISRKRNKEVINMRSKIYNLNNKEKIKLRQQTHYRKNKDNIIKKNNLKNKERRITDKLYQSKTNIRSLIRNSFTQNGYKKNTQTQKILGCSFEEFKIHIESKFQDWMTWDNYGLYNGEINYGWDIDHIIPSSTAKTEEGIIRLNHYTNLQPLCSYINRTVKRNKLIY